MPNDIVAKLLITQRANGLVEVEGTGPPLKNKAFAYGLLELAKDIIRSESRVEQPNADTISQFTKQ